MYLLKNTDAMHFTIVGFVSFQTCFVSFQIAEMSK